jgi:hypothetical protein
MIHAGAILGAAVSQVLRSIPCPYIVICVCMVVCVYVCVCVCVCVCVECGVASYRQTAFLLSQVLGSIPRLPVLVGVVV